MLCNTAWSTGSEYAEEVKYLCVDAAARPPYCLPDAYTADAEMVFGMLPDMLAVTMTRCALANKFAATVETAEGMAAAFRVCISGHIVSDWQEFYEHCEAALDSEDDTLYLPWEDTPQMEKLVLQAAMAEAAAAILAARVVATWREFVAGLEGEGGEGDSRLPPPIAWIGAEQVMRILGVSSSLQQDTENVSKGLLFFLLNAMAARPHSDAAAAADAAWLLNTKIRQRHRPPVADFAIGPLLSWHRLMTRTRAFFGIEWCRKRTLSKVLDSAHVIDKRAAQFSLFGTMSRLLRQASTLPLLARTQLPLRPEAIRAVRIREAIDTAFRLAHARLRGVQVSALLHFLASCPSPNMSAHTFLVHCFERALAAMFARFPGYASTWQNTLASMLACLSMGVTPANLVVGYTPASRRGSGDRHRALLAMANLCVRGQHPDTVVDLHALVEHVLALPPVQATTATAASFNFKPSSSRGVRTRSSSNGDAVVPSEDEDMALPSPVLPRTALLLRQVALNGLEEEETMTDGAAFRPLDTRTEFGHSMPTPYTLAEQMEAGMKRGVPTFAWSVAATALVWNMARSARAHIPAEVILRGTRSRKRARGRHCMACADEDTGDTCQSTCDHCLCSACAVAALQSRVLNAVVGDGSMEEQTHGNLGKCPEPGCEASILWAAPALGADVRFMLRRAMGERVVRRRCAARTHVKCYFCWDAGEAGTDGVTVCTSCTERTCNRCSGRMHPGDLCPDVLRGGGATPQDILSDAKQQPCPGCRAATTKDQGCNHLTCTQCGCNWCWACSSQMTLDEVTEHFRRRCSQLEYDERTETTRMAAAIRARVDLPEERKDSALRLLHQHAGQQLASDL